MYSYRQGFLVWSGAQPEIFQGRGGFVETGHFNKHFVENTGKKYPREKILKIFLLDTVKITSQMKNLTQRWQSGPFLQN